MDYIITTDTHFGHKKIMEFAQRPLGFEQLIIDNLEREANHNHILVHLGDVAWVGDKFWNRQLTSMPYKRKWLLKGNHDKKSDEWYLDNGWDFIAESIVVNFNNKQVVFSHKPREVLEGQLNIHGHFHNIPGERILKIEPELHKFAGDGRHILIQLEHEYMPISLNNILRGLNGNSQEGV